MRRLFLVYAPLVAALGWAAVGVLAAEPACAIKKDKPKYTTESLRGRVVWMAEALKDRFGIATDDDAVEALVALEEPQGRLHPIVKDQRGRCFYTDERLRGIDVELLARRYADSPMLQVVRVYTLKSGDKYELDYWCDICSIPMYELKPCECCQGPTRLRERLVKEDQTTSAESRAKSPTETK